MIKFLTFRNGITVILLLLFSSCGLQYVPIQTPNDKNELRKQVIIESLKTDFSAQNLKYKSRDFGEGKVLKPASFFTLDSLFEKKYALEKQNIVDKKLEDRIQIQKNICYSDSGSIFYIENHIFTIDQDSIFEAFNAEIYLDQKNKINSCKILEMLPVEKKWIELYPIFKYKKSFISPNQKADETEMVFYDLYNSHLQTLSGKEKDGFYNFTFSIMFLANKINSLDKSDLIKEQVKTIVHGVNRNFTNENFEKIEEITSETSTEPYYYILYRYATKESNASLTTQKVEIYLDSYLQVIETKKL